MPTLLHLDSSADLKTSVSRALTARFAAAWAALGPDHAVVRRDLHTDPLPHLPTNALHWAPRLRVAGEEAPAAAAELQQRLIQEVADADAVVIGAPMYNWSVPSTLKAWIDYVHVAGLTSPFDEPTQPFAGKPAVIVSSRGDQYGPGTPNTDHELPGLQQVLGVALGLELHVVLAELTLAPRIPPLAPLLARSRASRESAEAALDALAEQLGSAAAQVTAKS